MEKKVIKALRERQTVNASQPNTEDLDSIVEALTKFNKSIKAFRNKKSEQEEGRYGLLDSGATHNVREMKKDEDYEGIVPIEVEVAFDSEVKAELFMNP